jgi:hypothetical protein
VNILPLVALWSGEPTQDNSQAKLRARALSDDSAATQKKTNKRYIYKIHILIDGSNQKSVYIYII